MISLAPLSDTAGWTIDRTGEFKKTKCILPIIKG